MAGYKPSEKQKDMLVIILFVAISLLFLMPMLLKIRSLGVGDWDGRFAYSAIPRESIIKYLQFPLWNPYVCGGIPMLEHPESSFLSPFFVFILIFGEVAGLKILVLVHMVLGLAGMYLLSRYLGMGRIPSVFSSIIFMLSSHYSVHIAVGHTTDYLVIAYIPFAFLFYLKAVNGSCIKERFINSLVSSLSVLLMFLYGSTYILVFFALLLIFHAAAESIIMRKMAPLTICFSVLFMAAILGSVKLIPSLSFLGDNSIEYDVSWEGGSLDILAISMLSRNQMYDRPMWPYGWWEYSAYIGYIPFLILLAGIYFGATKRKSIIFSLLLFLWIYLGKSAPFNLWGFLHNIPIISFFRVPSRVLVIILFCISIMCGDSMEKCMNRFSEWTARRKGLKKPWKRCLKEENGMASILAAMIIVFVAADMALVSRQPLSAAFPFEHTGMGQFGDTSRFESTNATCYYRDRSDSCLYIMFLNNKGAMNDMDCGVERVNVPSKGSALPRESHSYKGEAYLANGYGNVTLKFFSPNRVAIDVDAEEEDRIVLNQNYYSGWRSSTGSVEPYKGLVSAQVSPGKRLVEFYYLPISFMIGIIAEIFAIILLIIGFFVLGRYDKIS